MSSQTRQSWSGDAVKCTFIGDRCPSNANWLELMSDEEAESEAPEQSELAARCHEIQTGLGMVEVAEFENLRTIGMAVRMALHIRGLPKFLCLKIASLNK